MATLSESSLFEFPFHPALEEYEKQTGINLVGHPLTIQFDRCDSVGSIIGVIQQQARAFCEFRGDNNKVMELIGHSVQVLHNLAGAVSLGGPIGLVCRMIYTSIGTLLATVNDANATQKALIDLFESIWSILKRLDIYTRVPPTTAITDMVMKVLIQLIPTLAVATKQVSQGRLEIFRKKLSGEIDVQAVLQRLDRLTQEEARTTAAQTLEVVYGLVQNVRTVMDDGNASIDLIRDALEFMQRVVGDVNKSKRDELQQRIRSWLSPPDPWKNHNIACELRHAGTTAWFIQGDTFSEWKSRIPSSLLWIHGKPGAGKSVVCSSIVEEIITMQKSGLASLAFFYCDFREDQKKDRRGLLSSLLIQLCHQSDAYCDTLSGFYLEHARGAHHPSDAALVRCLRDILKLAGQPPVYLIVDAVDECPNTPAIPSPREKILRLVEELIDSQLPHVHICITSRPEVDVKVVLEPLTFRSVSLHDESGQMEDITNYIKSVVNTDLMMRKWKTEDKELVIDVLTKNADGMFRWAYCQLVHLRSCLPGRIRHALTELPETLDETYRRTLREVNKTNWEFAHCLLQCVSVASRPLHVEELAQFLAFDFKTGLIPKFHVDWRTEDPIDAVLSTCSSLLSIINVEDSPVIQFSHFSVKEYLMSTRLAEESDINFRRYHVSMSCAHTLVARSCLGMLLHLDENITADSLRRFPLAGYAAEHWVDHARFGDVSHIVEDGIKDLFHPRKPHFAIWVWIYDQADPFWLPFNRDKEPPRPSGDPLHYAALYGFHAIAEFLILRHAQYVNCRGFNDKSTPLHRASHEGHVDAVCVLLQHGADAADEDKNGRTPLHWASYGGHAEVVRLLLDHGVNVIAQDKDGWTPLHQASFRGYVHVVSALLECGADTKALDKNKSSSLHWASDGGNVEVVRILLEGGAELDARDKNEWTPLHRASDGGHIEVVCLLLERGANLGAQDKDHWTPLHRAADGGHVEVVHILLDRGADLDARDQDQWTPLHRATDRGHVEAVRTLHYRGADLHARDKERWTPLHRASDGDHAEVVRILLDRGADLDARDMDRWTALHRASDRGHVDVVRVLLHRGGDLTARIEPVGTTGLPPSSRGPPGGTPLHRALDNGHAEVVQVLLEHGADLNTQDEEGWTPLHWASMRGHVEAVRELLIRGTDPDTKDKSGWTPLHWASYQRHLGVVRVLLERGTDPNSQDKFGWTPLHWASDRQYVEGLRVLLEYSGTDPNAKDKHGLTPLHLASKKGHVDIIRVLVNDTNLTTQDEDGQTALHHASYEGHVEAVRTLLEHGANPVAQNKAGRIPGPRTLSSRGGTEVALLLRKYRAATIVQGHHASS